MLSANSSIKRRHSLLSRLSNASSLSLYFSAVTFDLWNFHGHVGWSCGNQQLIAPICVPCTLRLTLRTWCKWSVLQTNRSSRSSWTFRDCNSNKLLIKTSWNLCARKYCLITLSAIRSIHTYSHRDQLHHWSARPSSSGLNMTRKQSIRKS